MTSKPTPQVSPREIRVVRLFDAPRELVFRNWIEPALISQWFAPDPFIVTECQLDARPGGKWRVAYRSDSGDSWTESGDFREIVPPERVVMTLAQQPGSGNRSPETVVHVTFEAVGQQTRMTFVQTGFETQEHRDSNEEGWNECFRKLERGLASASSKA
jgi:uncharacterized protein YndB with AHSA1/START domain